MLGVCKINFDVTRLRLHRKKTASVFASSSRQPVPSSSVQCVRDCPQQRFSFTVHRQANARAVLSRATTSSRAAVSEVCLSAVASRRAAHHAATRLCTDVTAPQAHAFIRKVRPFMINNSSCCIQIVRSPVPGSVLLIHLVSAISNVAPAHFCALFIVHERPVPGRVVLVGCCSVLLGKVEAQAFVIFGWQGREFRWRSAAKSAMLSAQQHGGIMIFARCGVITAAVHRFNCLNGRQQLGERTDH